MKASSTSDSRPILVTGGAGFIGCNLVDRLCRDGHRVVVYDSLARPGVDANAEWLRSVHAQRFEMAVGDVRDQTRLAPLVAGAKAVFHLAAQVAVTTSLAGPAEDFAVNAAATVGLLEMLRATNREAPLVFASTNKVYGDLAHIPLAHEGDTYLPRDAAVRRDGVAETVGLAFHTPYGCSKGAADQYVLDYGASFGLRTRRHAHELHLRPAPDGHGGPGLGGAFHQARDRTRADHDLRRWSSGTRRAACR